MNIDKMTKDELELMSNKDITYYILDGSNKAFNTADLYKKIMKLLELPESSFDAKIGDYYTSLATDKRFILLDDGTWDLRSRHTSDKVIKVIDTDEDDDDDENEDIDSKEKEELDEIEEDNYDDTDDSLYDDTEDDLKDFVVIDEEDLELEQ